MTPKYQTMNRRSNQRIGLPRLGLLWLGLGLLPLRGGADVYLTYPQPHGEAVWTSSPGWSRIYQAPIRFNGVKADLNIYGCAMPLSAVAARLRRAFGDDWDEQQASATFLQGRIRSDVRERRVVAIAPGSWDQTVVFVVHQAPVLARQTSVTPATGVPCYPGSRPLWMIENDDTRTTLYLATTPQPPVAVIPAFRNQLASGGWTPLSDDSRAGAALGFVKGSDTCWIRCAQSATTGESTITVLHKRGKME